MKIRFISDLHIDFDTQYWDKKNKKEYEGQYFPTELPDDLETTLIIAGDIWHGNKTFKNRYDYSTSWIEILSKRFKHIVLVYGNHDYWDCSIHKCIQDAKKFLDEQGLSNVYVLEKDCIILDNIKFIGTTLWTSLNNGDPVTMYSAKENMANDFAYIKNNQFKSINPEFLYGEFNKSKQFIIENAKRDNDKQKVLVITHHAPSFQSIHESYRTKADYYTNFSYFSDLDSLCYDLDIDYWFHGHTHENFNYHIHQTNVLCNPRGYCKNNLNPNFDDTQTIDLNPSYKPKISQKVN